VTVSDCRFCRIARKEIPAKLVFEDEDVVAFEDINPQAPVHVLVVPKRHIPTLNDLTPADDALLGKLSRVSARIAAERGVAEVGWRSVVNVNREGGQLVFHVHMHCLGGRPMFWPPG
jgi:histidine triad (HIT) family protein